uniref:Uncharacterized protein n=1 Tax=Branchiostoma floridae TaxID=7739 RepID=C3XR06_BRAFL|eukprot:XP_002613115.1 hypothetical protein BRAFLDRAFT_73018 [Branchiostoma floridae]
MDQGSLVLPLLDGFLRRNADRVGPLLAVDLSCKVGAGIVEFKTKAVIKPFPVERQDYNKAYVGGDASQILQLSAIQGELFSCGNKNWRATGSYKMSPCQGCQTDDRALTV